MQLDGSDLTVASSEAVAVFDDAKRRITSTIGGTPHTDFTLLLAWYDKDGDRHEVSVVEDDGETTWVTGEDGALSAPIDLIREANRDR